MTMHDVQEGLGQTGRFGEAFVGLGLLILLGGIGHIASPLFGFPLFPLTGNEPVVEALPIGILFVLEGVGFVVFGVMAIRSGWARHHPGSDF